MTLSGFYSDHPYLKRATIWFLLIWAMLIFHRLLFLIIYINPEFYDQWALIALQFLYGFRFDLVSISILLFPFIFSYSLAYLNSKRIDRLIRVFEYLQFFWLGIINMLLLASVYNYDVNNKHLGWEFWAYFIDSIKILKGLWSDSVVLFIVFVCIVPVWMTMGHFLFLQKKNRFENHKKKLDSSQTSILKHKYIKVISNFILILIAIIIGFRGGLGNSPLRTADAMRTQSSYLNNIALNGFFTVSFSLKGSKEYQEYYAPDVNIKFTRNLLDYEKKFISTDYPLLRYMPIQNHIDIPKKPNIVLIILESFTAKYLATHGGDPRIAPNLNKLINEGIYFERFMATGGRSANGLFSMFAGIPDRAGPTILRSTYINNNFGGVALLLRNLSYQTIFVHGGDLEFDNLATVLPRLGFEHLVGYSDLKKEAEYKNETPWGFDDSDSFKKFSLLLDDSRSPFFSVLFTVNTHHPYIISKNHKKVFKDNSPENRFKNSYNYTDKILGKFIQESKTKPWFNNTVFIILADHAHHRGLNYLEDRHIPLLLYAPKHLKPKRVKRLSSQLDVLPTVLSIAGGGSFYSALGSNLMKPPHKESFAFYAGGSGTNLIGWIEKEHLLVHSIDIKQQFLLKGTHPALQQDLSQNHKNLTAQLLEKTHHVQQFVRSLEKNNNAFPNEKIIRELELKQKK